MNQKGSKVVEAAAKVKEIKFVLVYFSPGISAMIREK